MYCCSISIIALRQIEAHQVGVDQPHNMENMNPELSSVDRTAVSPQSMLLPFPRFTNFSFVDQGKPEENARLIE
jgi:hypothetical protein